MNNIVKVLFLALAMSIIACTNQSCNEKQTPISITETSKLYDLDGGIVIAKMQSMEGDGTVYAMDVKYNGKNEHVRITKDEYDSFGLDDTIKIVKEVTDDAIRLTDTQNFDGGYKIVTVGGENYLVIKLNGNISINDTTSLK